MLIKDIVPYANNAKEHPQSQIDQIKASIKEFGFNDPLAIDENNVLIEGHGRLLALQQLGYEDVDVIKLEHLNEIQKKQYILAHNKITMNTGFDEEILKLEIEAIQLEADVALTGFDIESIEEMFPEDKSEVAEDEVPEVDETKEPYSKLGDLWVLGRHRVMCGDSTDKEDVEKLMNGQKATLAHNDPPYGMKKENEGVLNDNLNFDDLLDFNREWIALQFTHIKENGSWYCWGIDEPLMDIYSEILKPYIKEQKATFRNLITWDKGSGQGQNSENTRSYAIADEKCLFIMLGVQGFNNNVDNYFEGFEKIRQYLETEAKRVGLTSKKLKEICGVSMYSHWFSKAQWVMIPEEHYKKLQEYYKGEAFTDYNGLNKSYTDIKREYDEIKAEWYKGRAYFNNIHDNMNSVWHFDRTSQKEREQTGGHATPKPLKLCERVLNSSSQENDIVLDLFGGSGSTLIACEQTNRINYSMELDEKYVDVIVKRYNNLGKEDIKLIRDGVTYEWAKIKERFES